MHFALNTSPPLLAPDSLFQKYIADAVAKTAANISPLYRLDAFDWTVLILYFAILFLLSLYGAYRIKQVVDFWRYRQIRAAARSATTPKTSCRTSPSSSRSSTRCTSSSGCSSAVTAIDYPRERLEIQVLDDSTDETCEIAARAVERYRAEGFDISLHPPRRPHGLQGGRAGERPEDREGRAGRHLRRRLRAASPDCLRKLVHFFTDPLVGCAQMRWSHINGSYNLLTRLQTIMLDGHFVVEQTVRNRTGGFFNFNGTAGHLAAAQRSSCRGGWQHDTLTEDTDLSFRAQLMGWRFVYLLDEDAPAEMPVEINAFKAQQRRWAKGVMQVGAQALPAHLRVAAARAREAGDVFPPDGEHQLSADDRLRASCSSRCCSSATTRASIT